MLSFSFAKAKLCDTLNFKSNLHYTRGIRLKRVTSGGVYLRGLAADLHSSEETSQRWRVIDDTMPNLNGPGNRIPNLCADSDVFNHYIPAAQ